MKVVKIKKTVVAKLESVVRGTTVVELSSCREDKNRGVEVVWWMS